MITVFKQGTYKLIETKNNVKILSLDDEDFIWIEPRSIGEILVTSRRPHLADDALSAGRYCLYDVEDEDALTDLQHLELQYGSHAWQGYLLPTGLPDDHKKRARIIPTGEVITENKTYRKRMFNPFRVIRAAEIPSARSLT